MKIDLQLMSTEVQLLTSLNPKNPPWVLIQHVAKNQSGQVHTSPLFSMSPADAQGLIASIQGALSRLAEIHQAGAQQSAH